MITAFFDIDHTIIRNTSMERVFVKYLRRRGVITYFDLLRTAFFIIRNISDPSGLSIRSRRPYLEEKSVKKIETIAGECFKDAIIPLIAKEAIVEITRHKEAGHQIVLLSGTLEILARLLSRHVKADYYYACNPEVSGGYYTGKIIPPIPYGEGKRQILLSYSKEHEIDIRKCFAYGDSVSDINVFEFVGNPCVVNPGRKLFGIAREKGWNIVNW